MIMSAQDCITKALSCLLGYGDKFSVIEKKLDAIQDENLRKEAKNALFDLCKDLDEVVNVLLIGDVGDVQITQEAMS